MQIMGNALFPFLIPPMFAPMYHPVSLCPVAYSLRMPTEQPPQDANSLLRMQRGSVLGQCHHHVFCLI